MGRQKGVCQARNCLQSITLLILHPCREPSKPLVELMQLLRYFFEFWNQLHRKTLIRVLQINHLLCLLHNITGQDVF